MRGVHASRLGRPSLRPGRYFRLLFIGEGLSSERGIAWRVADEPAGFPGSGRDEAPPNHRRSRTRRLITWKRTWRVHVGAGTVGGSGLVQGRRSASMRRRWKRTRRCGASSGGIPGNRTRRSCVSWRRHRGLRRRRERSWRGLTGLGRTGRRPKRGSLRRTPKIAKMKDGRTHWPTRRSTESTWRRAPSSR